MQIKEFTKDFGDPQSGFTRAEAIVKQAEVNAEYKVDAPDSLWNRATIARDKSKVRGGYKVVITKKAKKDEKAEKE